jgi:Mn2+/Fe2+ NRAMP family transporter
MPNKISIKFLAILSSIGPGLFLIGYNIGTGSITTMAKSGAEFGMSLFWALLLSCVFTYIMMVAYGKTTLVTGKTALTIIKQNFRFGNILALYIMVALITGEILALMGIMGIVSDLLKEAWRLAFDNTTISSLWIISGIVIILYGILWHGRYEIFEKILTVFVIIMGLCFIIVFFMVKPSIAVIFEGLIPRIPDKPGAFQLVAAMAGTTCSAAVFIIRSIVVSEKGWNSQQLNTEKKDAFVSAFMMLLLSGIIMAVAAGTLHIMGLKLNDTVDMIHLFEPLGGKLAALILIAGVSSAGISTIFPIVLIAPWLISDYRNTARDIHSPMFRILGLIGLMFGFILYFIEQRPPALMIFSQAFQACILPAVAIPIFVLLNRSNLMHEHKAGFKMNMGLTAVIIFSLITSYFAITDLF